MAEQSIDEFVEVWREVGCKILEQQLQQHLAVAEAPYQGSRQRRCKHYHTPLGTIELRRRVYGSKGAECRGEKTLGLPADGWFASVKELSCALGVTSEFANANRLLGRWSRVQVSDKTLANHVEGYGAQGVETESAFSPAPACPVVSSVSQATTSHPKRPIFYMGADSIHTPCAEEEPVKPKSE